MRPGQVERYTHGDTRHGTVSLLAALDIATGVVIGRCYAKHCSGEARRFLDQVEAAVSANADIHIIMDNQATHKTRLIRNWLAKRSRWRVHVTNASWINQAERFFALITDKQIRRGVHPSTQALEADIRASSNVHNTDSKLFRWTKFAHDIQRCCTRTQQIGKTMESGHKEVLYTSPQFCCSLEHVPDGSDDVEACECWDVALVVLDQPTAPCDPGKGSFRHPAPRQQDEAAPSFR